MSYQLPPKSRTTEGSSGSLYYFTIIVANFELTILYDKNPLLIHAAEKRGSKASAGKSQRIKSGSPASRSPSLSNNNKREKKRFILTGNLSIHVMLLLLSKVVNLARHQEVTAYTTSTKMIDVGTDTAEDYIIK
jgi:hypothetical protein